MNNSSGTCFLTNVFSCGFPHRSHKIYVPGWINNKISNGIAVLYIRDFEKFLDPPRGNDLSCACVRRMTLFDLSNPNGAVNCTPQCRAMIAARKIGRRKMRYLANTRYRTLLRSICDICYICAIVDRSPKGMHAPVYNEDCCAAQVEAVLHVSFFFPIGSPVERQAGGSPAPRQVLNAAAAAAAAARFYSISRGSIKNLANLIYSRTRKIKS
uniref:Uncharacterized protein n=1 Tax=Trichogramma kaykai TaxID=54128 RepID=A0ABD2VWD7_9HYME